MVRFTDAAVADLDLLVRKGDPQVARWVVKKGLLLERNPEAGVALRGALTGFRKQTVGDRDWRVVWRVTQDDAGRPMVDVAEVWAVGARADSEVYEEMRGRVAVLSDDPVTVPLAKVIERLGSAAAGLTAGSVEPAGDPAVQPAGPADGPDRPPPDWLVQALIKVAGLSPAAVARLSATEAERRWDTFTSAPR